MKHCCGQIEAWLDSICRLARLISSLLGIDSEEAVVLSLN